MVSKHSAHLKHSQYCAEALLRADQLYEKGGKGMEEGLCLFDENWKNIEIGQKWAARQAEKDDSAATLTSEFPERGAYCLYLRQKPKERIAWLEAALQVAHLREFELVEGVLHGKIGLALTEMGEYEKAIEHYSTRIEIAERLNDFEGLGEGTCNLGILYDMLEMLGPAQECFQYALDLADKISNSRITEKATGNLGLVYLKQGKFTEAMECFERHLLLARKNGDQWSEGNALMNIGIVCLKLQIYDRASNNFQESLAIDKKLGDIDGEAKNLSYMGSLLKQTGDLDGAVSAYQARIALAQQLKDLRGEALGWWNLGEFLIKQKKYEMGFGFLYKCIDYEKSIGDPVWQADLEAVQKMEEIHGRQVGQ
jgi:tetratricopeptide (TPR) repeat protein